MPESPGVDAPGFGRLSAVAVAATYVLLLTGSSVVASDADGQCHSWPLCGSGFTPDFSGVNAFTMLHRGFVLVAGLFLVYYLLTAVRQCARWARRFAVGTLVVLAAQVAVGAVSAFTDAGLANGIHVALASLVWAGVCTTALLSLPRADRTAVERQMRVERTPV
jgi:protoheme IX farnesyltransferase